MAPGVNSDYLTQVLHRKKEFHNIPQTQTSEMETDSTPVTPNKSSAADQSTPSPSRVRRFVVDGVQARSAREIKVRQKLTLTPLLWLTFLFPSKEAETTTDSPATPEEVHEERMHRVSH